MKFLLNVLVFVSLSLVALTAHADQSTTAPDTVVQLSPQAAACLRACQAGATTAHPVCGSLDSATKARVEELAAQIRTLKDRIGGHDAKLADHERRLKALEDQVGLLNKGNGLQAQIDAIKAEMKGHGEAIEALKREFDRFAKDLVRVETTLGGEIERLKQRVGDLEGRVTELEKKLSYAKLGVRVGGLVLPAFDGSVYTGFTVGPRLTLALTEKTWVAVDVNALLSGSKSPLGMSGRGGVGYDVSKNWYLTGGLGASWVGYDSRLKAGAAYLTGDAGVGFRKDWFDVSLGVMVGPKFGRGGTSAAIGPVLGIGATF